MEWDDVQKARVTAMSKLAALPPGETAAKRSLLRDCCAISLLSLIPPDRVGCIRKVYRDALSPPPPFETTHCLSERPLLECACAQLRLGQTLKRKPGGGWKLDFSSIRDQHKTSRFCA